MTVDMQQNLGSVYDSIWFSCKPDTTTVILPFHFFWTYWHLLLQKTAPPQQRAHTPETAHLAWAGQRIVCACLCGMLLLSSFPARSQCFLSQVALCFRNLFSIAQNSNFQDDQIDILTVSSAFQRAFSVHCCRWGCIEPGTPKITNHVDTNQRSKPHLWHTLHMGHRHMHKYNASFPWSNDKPSGSQTWLAGKSMEIHYQCAMTWLTWEIINSQRKFHWTAQRSWRKKDATATPPVADHRECDILIQA